MTDQEDKYKLGLKKGYGVKFACIRICQGNRKPNI